MPLEDLGSLLDDGDGGGHFCIGEKIQVRGSFLEATDGEPART
jgi:hypothetical protein